jgi:hypothetical protein
MQQSERNGHPMETCQIPPELTEDELSALIDGEANARSQEHIRQCPYCAKRLARAKQIEDGLSKAFYRRGCPTSLELGQYHANLLDSPERQAYIETHLRTCLRCRQDLQALQDAIDKDEDEPKAVPDNIIAMPLRDLKRIVVFYEPEPQARGTARLKRILAKADSTTISLSFESLPDDRLKVTAQLMSSDVDWRSGMVSVQQDAQTVAVCHLNDYRIGVCELPKMAPLSLRFIAIDETLIEFNDVTP